MDAKHRPIRSQHQQNNRTTRRQPRPAKGTPRNPEPHVFLPPEQWNQNERYIWECVRKGEMADLNTLHGEELCPVDSLPKNDQASSFMTAIYRSGIEKWRSRKVRAEFVRTLLLCDPWREILKFSGLRINGTNIVGSLKLEGMKLPGMLGMGWCCCEGLVELNEAEVPGNLSLEKSIFCQGVWMDGIKVSGSIFMSESWCQGKMGRGEEIAIRPRARR